MPVSTSCAYLLGDDISPERLNFLCGEFSWLARSGVSIAVHVQNHERVDTHLIQFLSRSLLEIGAPLYLGSRLVSAEHVLISGLRWVGLDHGQLPTILAKRVSVLLHENFVGPTGIILFDAVACLTAIDQASLAVRKSLVPCSDHGRKALDAWCRIIGLSGPWSISPIDHVQVRDSLFLAASTAPADRRGRHFLPGQEKVPPLSDLDKQFPPSADCNILSGGNLLSVPHFRKSYWKLNRADEPDLEAFFSQFDFLIYFTATTWSDATAHELFDATAAGKLSIASPAAAESFGPGVIPATSDQVSDIVTFYVHNPHRYIEKVTEAQSTMRALRAEIYLDYLIGESDAVGGQLHDLTR